MPYYVMELNIGEKISDLAQSALGRRPVAIGESGRGRAIMLEFDPDLTNGERITLMSAMPNWIKKLYDFRKEEGTLRPEAT